MRFVDATMNFQDPSHARITSSGALTVSVLTRAADVTATATARTNQMKAAVVHELLFLLTSFFSRAALLFSTLIPLYVIMCVMLFLRNFLVYLRSSCIFFDFTSDLRLRCA